MADWSLPVDLNFPRGTTAKGTLTLSIKSGRGPEAISKSASICDAINARYGYQAVARIKVRQDLADKRLAATRKATKRLSSEDRQDAAFDADTLANMTTEIKSPLVRASLIKLGKAFKK